jgi:hypothetical protein
MIDLDAMDEEAAELERTIRTVQIEAKEKSRFEHQAKLEAAALAPKPVKAKPPAKRKKS